MKRPAAETLAALACAALLALLYASPVLPGVWRTGLDWPIWIDHPEGLIHTNTGKWLMAAPHRVFVDGASGEFPQYYAPLSDTLLNLVAAPLGIPAMTVQAVLYGPLTAAAFLLGSYLSLAPLLRDRRAALAASLLVALGGNALFADRPDPASGLSLDAVLHVPFHVIALGTSQSLGWVLLLPALCVGYRAYRERSRALALGAGLLLAALFYGHTLTFVNVGAVAVASLVAANAAERPRDARFKAYLAALGLVAAAFLGLVLTRPAVSFAEIAGLGTLALAAAFWIDPHKRFYAWCFLPAALLVLPYAALLVRHRAALAEMQRGWNQVQMMTVGLDGALLFFSAYLAAAACAYRFARDRALVAWLTLVLAATASLAVNHLWGWSNHPYRFAIHLLFPLAILGVLGLRHAPRLLAVPLGAWLAAICVANVWGFAAGQARSVRFRVAEPERARFLETVRTETGREAGSGVRILPPVELTYPRGLVQAAMLMNYAQVEAFIPDYRHVLWPERHHNRMGLYCFLFPGYPNQDYPFGWRACEEDLDPDPALVTILDPRLKTEILPLYRIGFAAAPGKPFSNYLKGAPYGWRSILETENAAFVRTDAAVLPGVARLSPGAAAPGAFAIGSPTPGTLGIPAAPGTLAIGPAAPGTLVIGIEPDAPGPHLLVLGGRSLERRAPRVALDGRPLETATRRGNWVVFAIELDAGPHRLELPALDDGPDPQADYLYFAAAVRRELASHYLALGGAKAAASSP